MAVMSDNPRLTSTTASVAAPSPGPTSLLTGVVASSVEVEFADRSVQYALRNTGPLRDASMISLCEGISWAPAPMKTAERTSSPAARIDKIRVCIAAI